MLKTSQQTVPLSWEQDKGVVEFKYAFYNNESKVKKCKIKSEVKKLKVKKG